MLTEFVNPELTESPVPSRWNYLVPAVAVTSWGVCALAAITYGSYAGHNYTYPDNPINPYLVSMALKTIEVTAIFGACTIPTAALWTVGRMFTRFGDIAEMREILDRSVDLNFFGKSDAILINTLAAPLAAPMLFFAFLGQGRRSSF